MRRDAIEGEARALREVATGLGRPGKTTPVPRHVRGRIVAFAALATTAGWTLAGRRPSRGRIDQQHSQLAVHGARGALVPVVVTVRPIVEHTALRVVAPSGYRVEGLDVSSTAAVLRALA